jgi:hypothetical protein
MRQGGNCPAGNQGTDGNSGKYMLEKTKKFWTNLLQHRLNSGYFITILHKNFQTFE